MFSRLSFSIVAALLLSAGIARAAPAGSEAGFAALEAGIPDSVDNAQRVGSEVSPTNEEIEALESGNPDSVGYRDRVIASGVEISATEWAAVEFANPELP